MRRRLEEMTSEERHRYNKEKAKIKALSKALAEKGRPINAGLAAVGTGLSESELWSILEVFEHWKIEAHSLIEDPGEGISDYFWERTDILARWCRLIGIEPYPLREVLTQFVAYKRPVSFGLIGPRRSIKVMRARFRKAWWLCEDILFFTLSGLSALKRPKKSDKGNKVKKESLVLACLAQHPDWSCTKIAQFAGCSRTGLYKMGGFRKVMNIRRSGKERFRQWRAPNRNK
jgi:hypothetical protein